MPKYAAIFYNIENLLKGYGSSQNFINSISLKAIYSQIKNTSPIERVTIQRAYANWSDPRLTIMKGEINELGIDPIQIFGFGRNQKKNAADIQLAVDAIDIAYLRNTIDIFVIVSGDGGFSTLAKKLHEYGKYVIGCAYKSSTNKIFESVCDIFIGIDEPEEAEPENLELGKTLKITNPKVLRMSEQISRLTTQSKPEMIIKSKEIINWLIKDLESQKELLKNGIHLSVIKEAFKYGIEDFNCSSLGFAKFIDFLRFFCSHTEVHVLKSDNFEVKIAHRKTEIKGFEALEDLSQDYLYSPENYLSILSSSKPSFKIVHPQDLKSISLSLASLPNNPYNLDGLLEYLNDFHKDLDSERINSVVLTLINADIFEREPENSVLSEQTLTLKTEYNNPDSIIKKVKEAMQNKLSSFWGSNFRIDIFNLITANL
ncbi:NYN domain-containing protein [Chroococcus sp. FPU101]|uniref:NYN domain-containing protein n=1 Tax=Chroococcus sp. FPU101 TaxID=1974212 RepID=UPI001A8EB411|nr:NYN domain-containing protein [Chroococcus sp. FPU101]GFE68765.1 hypothetical protein CFPU101_13750 [Chroococcus sp. FPU101]